MAPTIASGQKKNRRLGLFVFVVSFGARPVSKCKVHDFVLVHVIACLLFFFCFVWPHAMAPTIASDQKKNRRLGLFVFVVSSSVRLFICLIACLFVCLVLFSFVSFSVFLLFDDRCSNKCRNLDEYFDKNRQFYHFLCVPLKPTTFGVSFPEVIMIANVFTPRKHQILCFFYKTDKKNCGV